MTPEPAVSEWPNARFHHVGFVVASIEEKISGFVRSLGARWNGTIFSDPLQQVRVTFLSVAADGMLVELVEPAGEKSPVHGFLAKGGGLHHLCYEVDGLDGHLRHMRAERSTIVRKPQPAVAFGGRRIAWVYTAENLLVEFLERDRAAGQPGAP